MRIGATHEGKLVSLQQDYRNHTSLLDNVKENCGEATPFLYRIRNLQVTSQPVRRTVGTPTPMRGPGAVPGLFALESAMDELAIKLGIDPVEFRLRNSQQKLIFTAKKRINNIFLDTFLSRRLWFRSNQRAYLLTVPLPHPQF